jgi:hypothetical protein
MFGGEEGTAGSAAEGGCWSWRQTTDRVTTPGKGARWTTIKADAAPPKGGEGTRRDTGRRTVASGGAARSSG